MSEARPARPTPETMRGRYLRSSATAGRWPAWPWYVSLLLGLATATFFLPDGVDRGRRAVAVAAGDG